MGYNIIERERERVVQVLVPVPFASPLMNDDDK